MSDITGASITTDSILAAAVNAIKAGRIEDGLWRLEMVVKDLARMGEAEELGALVLKASEQGLRPFVGTTMCSATSVNMINHEVRHDGSPRGKIDALAKAIEQAGGGV